MNKGIDEQFTTKDEPTFTAKLYVAGPIEQAKTIIRRECFPRGLCVTIEPTLYIYACGEEAGYVVGLLNYPRYPEAPAFLFTKAQMLLETLIRETHQWSGLLVTPDLTRFISRRPEA